MACPLFVPASPLSGFAYRATPLGEIYGGECAAQAGTLIPGETLARCCNLGYARHLCERAAQQETDAHRFLIQSKSGTHIEVAWSAERDHHPVAVGTLSLSTSAPGADTSPLERQARAYAQACLGRSQGS